MTGRARFGSRGRSSIRSLATLLAWCPLLLQVDGCSGLGHAAEPGHPNIVVILADDLGYADIGHFGSEIRTPNLDRLAAEGTVFTDFYAASTCSPTRAMLMSGVDNHLAGLGSMAEMMREHPFYQGLLGLPGYEGYLNDRVAVLPELLREQGYRTYMAGKWHLGPGPQTRGFDRSFALLDGGASHFSDMAGGSSYAPIASYVEDGKPVTSLPADFYSSDYYADRMIEFIADPARDAGPFFAYLAFTAPHYPLQAPQDEVTKYAGEYDDGYDAVRARRFAELQERGISFPSESLPSRDERAPGWQSLSSEEQAYSARLMETYAAMVSRMDSNIGRLLDALEEQGLAENTVILFLSDNGAEGSFPHEIPSMKEFIDASDNSLANAGKPGSFTYYGPGWAQASTARFQGFKFSSFEGGVRVPAIAYGPGLGITQATDRTPHSVLDILPTALDLAGVADIEGFYAGRDVLRPEGRTIAAITGPSGSNLESPRTLFWELGHHRAVRQGPWKAVWPFPYPGPGRWQLFNLIDDPGESRDVSDDHPAILSKLEGEWNAYAQRVGVQEVFVVDSLLGRLGLPALLLVIGLLLAILALLARGILRRLRTRRANRIYS